MTGMTKLMEAMTREATAKLNDGTFPYASAKSDSNHGRIVLQLRRVNTNSKHNQITRNWTLNGKRIAMNKLSNLS